MSNLDNMEDEIGVSVEAINDDIHYKLEYLRVKRIEWTNSRTCYAIMPDGRKVRIFFDKWEDQIITRHTSD